MKQSLQKVIYILGGNLQNLKIKKNYTFLYKEAQFSKSKYFLVIIIQNFFSFYNIFFYTQQAFAFHLLRDFCNAHCCCFFFFYRKILISSASFFFSFLYFLDNILLINFYIYVKIYIYIYITFW